MTELRPEQAPAYRKRAEEIRIIAEGLRDRECRTVLLDLARAYDDKAARAEKEKPRR